jgi:DNA-binding transcriptional LysR family regulator
MELRQLQHFLAVAEERHFTRAAQRVNIVQSALSTSIRALEEELDAPLFVRSTRQVRLTAVGRVLLDKARLVLDAADEARNAVAAAKGLTRGTLGIGTVQGLPAFLGLPALIAGFHARHPGVEVRLCQGKAAHLLDKVRSGCLDLVFLPLDERPPGVTTRMIACEALVLVCAAHHPLAGREEVDLSELQSFPFVDFEPDWGTRRLIDRAFRDTGATRQIAFEVSDLDTQLELVRRGLGIALIPQAIAEARRSALGIVHLAQTEICWELFVAHAHGDHASETLDEAAAQEFLASMLDASGRIAG